MKKQTKIKHIHESGYVAEVEIEIIEDETGWSPYIPVEEAEKLDAARDALKKGNLEEAAKYGDVYELRKVS
jgi:hypothetical protein